MKTKLSDNDIRLGEISGLHGVQGWIKVFSDTQPRENIFTYSPWLVYRDKGVSQVEVLHWRKQGKTLVAQLKDINGREQAREFLGAIIAIKKADLPALDKGAFYWSQLTGLRVKTSFLDDESKRETYVDLGVVDRLMETGANDVLVVCGDADSIDKEERLIPWVPDQFILGVDLDSGEINVDWDPEF